MRHTHSDRERDVLKRIEDILKLMRHTEVHRERLPASHIIGVDRTKCGWSTSGAFLMCLGVRRASLSSADIPRAAVSSAHILSNSAARSSTVIVERMSCGTTSRLAD